MVVLAVFVEFAQEFVKAVVVESDYAVAYCGWFHVGDIICAFAQAFHLFQSLLLVDVRSFS